MSSVNLAALPLISFAPMDSSEIESTVLSAYEKLSGITLQPGDPVRLFLESLAYLINVQNGLIDLAGKQNLLAYASGAHLDHLGALMGVSRIPAQAARTSLRFKIAQTLEFAVPIPAGSRVASRDGRIVFATIAYSQIHAGKLFADVAALCTSPGEDASGLLPGQLNRLVDPLPYVTEVENVTTTDEGMDIEPDSRLRERIRIAPESWTVAGSRGAYEARVLEISSAIAAVSVTTPEPGVVDVRFVLDGGEMPDSSMCSLVLNYLSSETIRPLTDKVLVGAPDPISYDLNGKWYLRTADSTLYGAISANVEQALSEYRLWQRQSPGRDINPSKLISLIEHAGAKRVELVSPVFRKLEPTQIAREQAWNFTFGGIEDD